MPDGRDLCVNHDIQSGPNVWQEESPRLPLDLFDCRIGFSHVYQRFRRCRQIDICWPKSIHPPFDIRLRHCRRRVHPSTNELLQQSPRSILHVAVSSIYGRRLLISSVNPLYYVTFTTATLCASFILFKGFNTTSAVNTLSLLCGFLVIFSGVYLLNYSRTDPHGFSAIDREMEFPLENGISAAVQGRRSLQGRRSNGDARRAALVASSKRRQEDSLLRAFNEEEDEDDLEMGLDRVSEEDDSIETVPEHHSPKSPRR